MNLSSANPGVVNKTINISKALNSFDCLSFSLLEPGFKLNHEVIEDHGLKKVKLSIYSSFKIQYLLQKSILKYFSIGFIKSWMFKKMFFKSLLKYQLINNIDVIIIRYPFASLPLYNFLKISNSKVFLEFNTFELEEFKSQNRFFKISLKYYSEIFLRKRILKVSDGIFGVTNEIIEYQNRFFDISKKPTFLISNGIGLRHDFSSLKKTNSIVNFVILIGEEQPWHGIDRLISSLKKYPLSTKSNFYFVGDISTYSYNLINKSSIKNVSFIFLGLINLNEQIELLKNVHIGIGSLCLFRNSMSEACPLKVRDYALHGLPVIIGYNDTDLTFNKTLKQFTFQVDNNESAINFNKVIFWYRKFTHNDLIDFSKYSQNILSYKKKLKPFFDYIKKLE